MSCKSEKNFFARGGWREGDADKTGFTAEVDFTGAKAPYMGEDNTIHYADVIVIVLPYSRKEYAQAIHI